MREILLALALIPQAVSFQPRILANGDRVWSVVVSQTKIEESVLAFNIESKMGETQFCPRGWEITKREELFKGYLTVTGRCL